MAKKWKDVRRRHAPEVEARIADWVKDEIGKMPLAEVRRAREMTQVRLAELLEVNQPAISRIEKQSDMYLSTLRSYIEAMGGNLEIRAVFNDREVFLEGLSPHIERADVSHQRIDPRSARLTPDRPKRGPKSRPPTPAIGKRRDRTTASGR